METLTECTVESVGLSLQLKGEKKKKKSPVHSTLSWASLCKESHVHLELGKH